MLVLTPMAATSCQSISFWAAPISCHARPGQIDQYNKEVSLGYLPPKIFVKTSETSSSIMPTGLVHPATGGLRFCEPALQGEEAVCQRGRHQVT